MNNADIIAKIILHSIDKDNFELTDISFEDEETRLLEKQLESFQTEGQPSFREILESSIEAQELYGKLCSIDAMREMASEDLGEYGDVLRKIHNKLWEKAPEEMYHTVNVSLRYSTVRTDYWSAEYDTKVDFDFEVLFSSKQETPQISNAPAL